jgi:hypothetical protein
MKDVKMCMMIRGVAGHLWIMKIRCVQYKRRFKTTDDSPFRHFSWIFYKISLSLLHEIVSDKLRFRKLYSHWVFKMLMEEHKLKQKVGGLTDISDMIWWARWWLLVPHSHRGWDRCSKSAPPRCRQCSYHIEMREFQHCIFWRILYIPITSPASIKIFLVV